MKNGRALLVASGVLFERLQELPLGSRGMLLDSSPYQDDQTAQDLAEKVYTNARINAIAAGGKAFRPVEGDSGDQATDVFVREAGAYYLAVFNFNRDAGASKQIPLNRLKKALAGGTSVAVTDVWTDTSLGSAAGTLDVSLGPGEAKLLKLVP